MSASSESEARSGNGVATSPSIEPPGEATEFPAFLPPQVTELEEEAARQLARRVQRLPVQTKLASEPIMSSCIVPKNFGQTAVPILLFHGFDSSCLEWRRVYQRLEEGGAEPWAVDTLGWGFSDTTKDRGIQSFSVDAKREHLYQFWRQHLGGRPALLVGPSLGGAAAIDLAVNHPDVPAGLLLLDAQAFQEGVGPLAALPKFLAYAGVALLKSVQLRMSAIKMAFHDKTLSTEDAMNVGRLHCLMPDWADAMVDFMRSGGYHVSKRVGEVSQPCLVVWGSEDEILEPSLAERFKAELPDCRDVVHLQGCGHIPHVERPADVAQLILEFCSQLQGERERDGAEEEKVAVA
ncbi:unnamed protein product [Closterium sp. Naga37s-1]|nr:unnamed protein product [Closterium sp. Naga37s-1]